VADIEEAALDRARAKRDQIERELKKCPDFQLYLLTRLPGDRTRMEQLLDQNPRFRLWRVLAEVIAQAVDEADRRKESAVNDYDDWGRMTHANRPVIHDASIVTPVEGLGPR
jgi:hypothetical protein